MINKEFLTDYLNAYSPVGMEMEGQSIWINRMSQIADKVETDQYGNAMAYFMSDVENAKTVVLEAHCDEIAWQITNIESNGIIRINRNGGSDSAIAPSKTGLIHTRKNGKVPCVFGFPAIHVRKGETKAPKAEDIIVDTGFDKREDVIKSGVRVGDMITFDDQLKFMGNTYVGRSLDNKIGGVIISEVGELLRKHISEKGSLPFNVVICNCITEEVGLLGAGMIAKRISPDVALVVDVCHHTNTPTISKSVEGDVSIGKGPAIELKFQNHRVLTDLYETVAEENGFKYQHVVGSTGNDTMAFYKEGIPTAILGIPLKYMHTTVETVHSEDVENAINIFFNTLLKLDIESVKYH